MNVVAVAAVADTLTSAGFKTFLANGITLGPGYPFITSLISQVTGSVSSFAPKYKSTLVAKQPPSSVINMVCASGSYHCNLLTVVLNVCDVVSSTLS